MNIASVPSAKLRQLERSGYERIGTLTFGSGFNMFTSAVTKNTLDKFYKIKNPKHIEDLIYKTFLNKD